MVPSLIDMRGAPWPVLPSGVHAATLAEIQARFANTPHRKWLFNGFIRAADALRVAGCRILYLDGSFVTGKPHPDDYDGCWEHIGIDFTLLDPVLLDFAGKREAQKRKYQGELFPALASNGVRGTFLDFFQVEKFSGVPKGILRVSLGALGASP